MTSPVALRHYQNKDVFNLRDICKETAWDSYKKDPKMLETVPINFLDYFIEQEPDHVWVAVDEKDRAIGYIECNTNYRRFVKATKTIYFPRLKQVEPSQIAFERQFLLALFFIRR